MTDSKLLQRLADLEAELATLRAATTPRRAPPTYGSWHVGAACAPATEAELKEQAAMAERSAIMPGEFLARQIHRETVGVLQYRLDEWAKLGRDHDGSAVKRQIAALEKAEAARRAIPANRRASELCDAFEQHESEEKQVQAAKDAAIVAQSAKVRLAAKLGEIERRRAALAEDEGELAELRKVAAGA